MHVPLKQHDISLHQTQGEELWSGLASQRCTLACHFGLAKPFDGTPHSSQFRHRCHTISELPFRLLRLRFVASQLRGAIAVDRLSLVSVRKPPCAAGDALCPSRQCLACKQVIPQIMEDEPCELTLDEQWDCHSMNASSLYSCPPPSLGDYIE